MTSGSPTEWLTNWRRIELGGRAIIEGVVPVAQVAPGSPLRASIAGWHGHHYWQRRSGVVWLVLVEEPVRPRERWWLHALLLLATLVTTSFAGAEWLAPPGASIGQQLRSGLPFSIPLLLVLGAHEMGHFLVARRYRVDASAPFFLPFPSWNIVGTLGAFVRLRSPIFDRQTLFDVGVAGPLAGLAIAVPFLALGLARSEAVAVAAPAVASQFLEAGGNAFFLGDSALVTLVRAAVGASGVLRLHPFAVAGWTGVFVTMLNLLPLAQFDGGHALFALVGRRQVWLARAALAALVVLGWWWWPWWIWAGAALALSRGRLEHPRIHSAAVALDRGRVIVGWAVMLLFVLCFSPIPVLMR